MQGNYSELMVILSACFSQLRGDQLAEAQGGSAQVRPRVPGGLLLGGLLGPRLEPQVHLWGCPCTTPFPTPSPPVLSTPSTQPGQAFKRSTTKYWVRTSDVSTVKRIIIENMPGERAWLCLAWLCLALLGFTLGAGVCCHCGGAGACWAR